MIEKVVVIVLATVMVLDDVMILSHILLFLLLLIGLIVLAHVMVLTYVMALIPEMGGNHYNNTTSEMVLTMLCYVNLCYDLILRNGINPCFCVSLCYGVTCVTVLTHVMVLACVCRAGWWGEVLLRHHDQGLLEVIIRGGVLLIILPKPA